MSRTRQHVRAHASYWARPQSGELTYVALGDSAGVGVGVDDPRSGYVGIVARRLAAVTGRSVRTLNLAISGARVDDVIADQLPRLREVAVADLVTCVVGGNDVAWAPVFRKERFRRSVETLVQQLPSRAVLGLLPHFVHWPMTSRAASANRIIRTTAAGRDIVLADLSSPTRRLSARAYLGTFSTDFFHPNESGYEIWADAVWEGVERSRRT